MNGLIWKISHEKLLQDKEELSDNKHLFRRFAWTLSLHLRSSTTCTESLTFTRCQEYAKLRFYKIFHKCLASYNPIEAQKRN